MISFAQKAHGIIVVMRTCLKILPFVLLLLPITGLAQDTGLIPCGYGDEACNTAHVAEFANTIISYLISILSIFAVIVLVITGFQMVVSAGNSDQWGVLTQRLTNIVIGIVLILAAWLIVDTIMKALTGDGLDVWGRLTGGPAEQVAIGDVDSTSASAEGRYTDADAREALEQAKITVWESAPGRTRLDNINQATIAEAVRVRQACNCAVTVTGGTESGHADGTYSHASGHKIDLDDSPGLTNYITTNYNRSGTRKDGAARYISPSGAEYYREGDHWDIVVK